MGRRLSCLLRLCYRRDHLGAWCCGMPLKTVMGLVMVGLLGWYLLSPKTPAYSEAAPAIRVLLGHWNVSRCDALVLKKPAKLKGAVAADRPTPKRQLIVADDAAGTCVDPAKVDAGSCFLSPGSLDKARCLPSVIIAGTQKASTDLLRDVLSKHPNVHMGGAVELVSGNFVGEMHYFDNSDPEIVRRTWWSEYLPFFEPIKLGSKEPFASDVVMMEKTPKYMVDPSALTSMQFLVPSVKLIVLLREPVARTYSGFQHTCKKNAGRNTFGTGKKGSAVATMNLWAFYAGLGSSCSPEQFHAYITGKAQRNGVNRTAHSLEKEAKRGNDKLLYNAWKVQQAPVGPATTQPPRRRRAIEEEAVRHSAPEVQRSLYAKQVRLMLSLFPSRNLCVIIHEAFRTRNQMLKELGPLQEWAGLPAFDYGSLLNTAKDGGVYVGPISYWSTHSRLSGYDPMLDDTRALLEAYFSLPNKALWNVLSQHPEVTVLPNEAQTQHPW